VGYQDEAGTTDAVWSAFLRGEPSARDHVLAAHYDEFRNIARKVLRDEGARLAIQPTELAHEAALRLLKLEKMAWRDRTHLLAMSARLMRQVLLDEVRRFRANKRQAPEIVTQWIDPAAPKRLPIEDFDAALTKLFAIDRERARIVELRFYAGLTLEEIAQHLEISESTVMRRWRAARAWLLATLAEHDAD
jgi:RNA polymerase sigma factor (TIGR02999 family)